MTDFGRKAGRASAWMFPLVLVGMCGTPASPATDISEFKATMTREHRGPHNDAFQQEFAALHGRLPPTKDYSVLDKREFLEAHRLIVNRSQDVETGGTVQSAEGLELPVAMFSTFERELARTFKARLDVEDEAADVMAGLLEKQAVEMAGVSFAKYIQAKGGPRNLDMKATAATLRGALEFLFVTSTIGARCDVPFIAGYAHSDERVIYIDRAVPEHKMFRNVEVPVHKLLNAHERVEKALLDEYGATYQHAHQIALRLEKLFAEEMGVPWHAYDEYWGPLAEAVNARHFTRVPEDLDMTPYLSFTDADSLRTVDEMKAAYVGHQTCFRDRPKLRAAGP